MIEELLWDSTFFNIKVGRCIVKNEIDLNSNVFTDGINSFDLLYIYSNELIPSLKDDLVDRKVTFSQDLNINSKELINNVSSYVYEENSYQKLLDLALQSGVHSRFNIDKNISKNKFEELYGIWILKSVKKENAFDVLVHKNNKGEIAGFITLFEKEKNVSAIGLIAVDRAERGKGIAGCLINKAIQESIKKGYKKIEVVTQQNNEPAMKLYSKYGFKEKELNYIYHKWKI